MDDCGYTVMAGYDLPETTRTAVQSCRFFKTKMCKFGNVCPYGLGCPYAHALHELRAQLDLSKTGLCTKFRRGKICPRGETCPFAHGENELRCPRPAATTVPLPVKLLPLDQRPLLPYVPTRAADWSVYEESDGFLQSLPVLLSTAPAVQPDRRSDFGRVSFQLGFDIGIPSGCHHPAAAQDCEVRMATMGHGFRV
mmetsp:Transcript_44544/g.103797  ORF Transcript_44544/g.103797 Transcript_44544/m.103797 type:complete len:196 (+) Transcript_44544:24-611(+)